MKYPDTAKGKQAVEYAALSLDVIANALATAQNEVQNARYEALKADPDETNGYRIIACLQEVLSNLAPVPALAESAKHILMQAAKSGETK